MTAISLEHPLFVALTRPPMLFGVTLDYLACIVITVLCHFLLLNQLVVLLFYIPLHVLGYIACRVDCHIFRLLAKHLYCRRFAQGKCWGSQTYEPF